MYDSRDPRSPRTSRGRPCPCGTSTAPQGGHVSSPARSRRSRKRENQPPAFSAVAATSTSKRSRSVRRRRDRLGLARLAQRRAVPSVVVELRPATGAGRAGGLALGPLLLGRAAQLLLVLLLLCSRPLCPAGEDGIQEIATLAGQRRHGAGSKLRTDLLTGITAKRTTLTVRPEAPAST